ncbi:MAG: dihydrolipoamide acetyltransferase family protein [Chloroflexota bacterium]|nr:dihydrolipoamide acetyltransferase family protein [Chloroflexota bacterium]
MLYYVRFPQFGESVTQGIIGKWLAQPGQRVEKYAPLVEVVTDKVTVEVPSPASGQLMRHVALEGTEVAVGAPIAEMEVEGALPQDASGPASTTGVLLTDVRPVGPTGGAAVAEEALEGPGFSPAVRRLAREHGVDLALVRGTGLGGRVSRDDVLGHIESRAGQRAATATPQTDEESLPLSPTRRLIAQHMTRSAREIPHAWTLMEADVTGLVALRQTLKEEFSRREAVDLTYLPFFLRAVAKALAEHPRLNASWGGERIILKRRRHIGIAVAAPDGLVVPVVHDADRTPFVQLARKCRDLTERARAGKLALQDVQGGTFTLNNTGALGVIVSAPIINHPQAAILTTEAIQRRPVVVAEQIAIRSVMNLCLSFDHRIADGAEAAAFLRDVKARLESLTPGFNPWAEEAAA